MKKNRLPKLVVFDLDFTLWDCDGTWCDCLRPPFRVSGGQVFDSAGYEIKLYPDVPEILSQLGKWGCSLALASRTERPSWGKELVRKLGISDLFAYSEIYPSSKLRHFKSLKKLSGIEYDDMLFFDDEKRNIVEVSSLGVDSVHVRNGINLKVVAEALENGWKSLNEF